MPILRVKNDYFDVIPEITRMTSAILATNATNVNGRNFTKTASKQSASFTVEHTHQIVMAKVRNGMNTNRVRNDALTIRN